MADEARKDWDVTWSHQVEGRVGAVLAIDDKALIAAGPLLRLLDADGEFIWRREFTFDVYRVDTNGKTIGVLSGIGFFLLDLSSGELLGEGRAVAGGFRDLSPRPGGGWVLLDRGDHIHLFNRRGRGIQRLKPGPLRQLVGWLDRELLLVLDMDGCLRCLRLTGEMAQRRIEDRRWSWVSRLARGRMLMQAADGSIHEGVPNPFGWDSFEGVSEAGLLPLAAAWTGEGWWLLQMSGDLCLLPPLEDDVGEPAGDLLAGNGIDRLVTATRDGLVRMWVASHLADRRRLLLEEMASAELSRLDWKQRETIFEAARDAEEAGMLSRAIELYEALGRIEDVRRLLALREGAS